MADTAITLSDDRISPLSIQEQAATGFSHKFLINSSDIAFGSGSTDTVTVTLGATPAKFIVNAGLVNVTTAFAGTGAMTIIVGTALSTAALIASTSILTAGALVATSTTLKRLWRVPLWRRSPTLPVGALRLLRLAS